MKQKKLNTCEMRRFEIVQVRLPDGRPMYGRLTSRNRLCTIKLLGTRSVIKVLPWRVVTFVKWPSIQAMNEHNLDTKKLERLAQEYNDRERRRWKIHLELQRRYQLERSMEEAIKQQFSSAESVRVTVDNGSGFKLIEVDGVLFPGMRWQDNITKVDQYTRFQLELKKRKQQRIEARKAKAA